MKIFRKRLLWLALCWLLAGCLAAPPAGPTASTPGQGSDEADLQPARQQMVETIEDWGVEDPQVLAAMAAVPRHQFVPTEYQGQAYANHPLPIGFGQTISQPVIVAMMTSELGVQSGDKVLEIGTGSGYQAAVLAQLDLEVYSIEIIESLAERAVRDLSQAGYDQVQVRVGDGYFGWPDQAPFDAILVTAAPDHVPQPLIEQLKIGGRLLIPIGPPGGYQELWRITRTGQEQTERVSLGGVRFVPLVRDQEG